MGNGLDLLSAPPGQVCALWKVLPQEAVRVLVRATLPWTVRVGKEYLDPGLDREAGVIG